MVNRQERQISMFHGNAYPKETPNSAPTPHIEAVHHQQVLLGVHYPCLWPLKAPGCTFGRVAKRPPVNPLMPVPPAGLLWFYQKEPHTHRKPVYKNNPYKTILLNAVATRKIWLKSAKEEAAWSQVRIRHFCINYDVIESLKHIITTILHFCVNYFSGFTSDRLNAR